MTRILSWVAIVIGGLQILAGLAEPLLLTPGAVLFSGGLIASAILRRDDGFGFSLVDKDTVAAAEAADAAAEAAAEQEDDR